MATTTPSVPGPSSAHVATDVWDRMERLWDWLFLGMLVLPTVFALTDARTAAGDRVAAAGLAVSLAIWHLTLFRRLPRDRRYPAWTTLGYWVVVATGAMLLTGLHPVFTLVMYGLYPLMFMSLDWWGIPGIAGITALLGWQAGHFSDGSDGLVSVLASSAVALAVAVFIDAIARQSSLRREALDALAATRSELAVVAHRAGALEERDRLAREIHDTVAQGLVSVVTQLEAAEQALPEGALLARRHLGVARQAARDGLAEVRRSVQALRPELLEGKTLEGALTRLCHRWSSDTGIVARLQVGTISPSLQPEAEVALLRTAQEALANVAKHAHASAVTVSLDGADDLVRLHVTDDGIGLPGTERGSATDVEVASGPEPASGLGRGGTGFGLVAMAERIAAVGGHLDVIAAPGRGTTVAAEVPW